jgi:hypothetical protein
MGIPLDDRIIVAGDDNMSGELREEEEIEDEHLNWDRATE